MGESLLRTQPQYEVKLKSCQFTEHPARDDLCFSFFLRLFFFHWFIFGRKGKREKKKAGLKLWNKTNGKSEDCPWIRWNERWNVLFLSCMSFTHYFCIFISHITPTCMSSSLDDVMSRRSKHPTDARLLSSQTSHKEHPLLFNFQSNLGTQEGSDAKRIWWKYDGCKIQSLRVLGGAFFAYIWKEKAQSIVLQPLSH